MKPKRWKLVFRADRHRKKTVYAFGAEADMQGEKEKWAMILEKETGLSWRCEEISEASPAVGENRGKED